MAVVFWIVAIHQASLGMGISLHQVSSGILVMGCDSDATLPEDVARGEGLFSYDLKK